jgi:hypothetical protein
MGKYLFGDPEQSDEKHEFQVEIPIFPVVGAPVFTRANLKIQIDDKKVIITPQLCTDKVLGLAETVARKILKNLPHTPLLAFGINFWFVETNPPPDLFRVFDIMEDRDRLAEHAGIVEKVTVTRSIGLEGCVLNLTIAHEASEVHFHFNFHFGVTDALVASKRLESQVFSCRSVAQRILEKVYSLHEEVSEEHGDDDS